MLAGLVGEANWLEGEERRGWRWDHIFCASEMAFSRMKRCLGFVVCE